MKNQNNEEDKWNPFKHVNHWIKKSVITEEVFVVSQLIHDVLSDLDKAILKTKGLTTSKIKELIRGLTKHWFKIVHQESWWNMTLIRGALNRAPALILKVIMESIDNCSYLIQEAWVERGIWSDMSKGIHFDKIKWYVNQYVLDRSRF